MRSWGSEDEDTSRWLAVFHSRHDEADLHTNARHFEDFNSRRVRCVFEISTAALEEV